jgi:hypothetical protein
MAFWLKSNDRDRCYQPFDGRQAMNRIVYAMLALGLAAAPFHVSAQDKKDRDKILAAMMQKKLKSAHLVLDGVATGDFKTITIGGQELIRLAKSETWQLIESPLYERHSADFIRATEKLVKKAQEKNIDGTALAYVEMTLSCVRCHQYVREHRRDARFDPETNDMLRPRFASLDDRRGRIPMVRSNGKSGVRGVCIQCFEIAAISGNRFVQEVSHEEVDLPAAFPRPGWAFSPADRSNGGAKERPAKADARKIGKRQIPPRRACLGGLW